MKKISLRDLDAFGIQRLSRENLKNVTGGGCPAGEFMCGDGSCVSKMKLMDGVYDCSDGSDERENYTRCECIGSVGSWSYPTPANAAEIMESIRKNCSSGQGSCA